MTGKVITLAEYRRLGWMQRGILPVFCCMPSAEAQPVLLNQRLAKLLHDLPYVMSDDVAETLS